MMSNAIAEAARDLRLKIADRLGSCHRLLEHVARQPELSTERDRLFDEEAVLASFVEIAGLEFVTRVADHGIGPCARLPRTPARRFDARCRRRRRGVILQRELFKFFQRDGCDDRWRDLRLR